jgi:heme/copper-type cytochrome/quinol oxidase subunit 2
VVLNKNGQVIFYTMMLMIVVVLLALALSPIVNTFVVDARNSTTDSQVGLDCENETISDYTKSQCILTDITTPYFFFGLIGIALLIIGARVMLGQ